MMGFLVNVLHISTGMHNALWILAVNQSESMAQFMDYLFSEPGNKCLFIGFQSVSFIFQPVNRCDSAAPVQKGLAKNKGKNGNVEVNVEQPDCFFMFR